MRILIEADRLFDGTGAPPIERAAVLVEDGRVRAVGRAAEFGRPEGDTRRLSYDGCTVLPGLIDSHVHLVFSAGADPVRELLASDDRALMLRAVHNAQTALRAGITTLKDLGGRGGVALALREAIAAGVLPGPRILAAGPPITTTGGHCHWMGGEADTADDLRRKVRELAREGVDLIKVMSSGGRMTPGSNVCAAQYTLDQLRALVEDARRLGRTVAAHAQGTAGIRGAVAAGVNIVEHCTWVSTEAGNRVEYDETVAEEMARRGIFIDPTISGGSRLSEADPATLRPSQRETREIRPRVIEAHRRSVELGVEVAAGTDAGVTNLPFDRLPGEIRLLHEQLGLSPAEAIRAATYNGARAITLDDDLGTVQPGRRADLLIVPGNPLQDLAALGSVRAVYKDGVLEVEDGRLVHS